MIYFLAIASAFVQTIVTWLHLPILVILYYAAKDVSATKVYILAFVTGLLADLVLGNQLGVLAGFYLLVALGVSLYKSKFRFNLVAFLIFAVISQIIFFYARGIFK